MTAAFLCKKLCYGVVKMSLQEILMNGGGALFILLTLVQIAPIKVNPWSTLAKWFGRAINADMLKEQIVPIVEELGEFEGFDKEAVTGAKDPDTEQEFAVAVIKVKYEKRKAQFTISFDEDMKVAGFFIK